MSKKKKKDKKKQTAEPAADLEAEIQRLREENEMLRARLEKISELASEFPSSDEDESVDEHGAVDETRAQPVSVGLS